MRDVGRGAAHVEADDALVSGSQCRLHRADDTASGTGQDRVLALKTPRIGEAAVGLHEHQAHILKLRGKAIDVTSQDRRQIGIDHGGIAAADQFHQRADFLRHRNLGEAGLAREAGDQLFMRGIAVAVHQHDRERTVTVGVQ